MTVRGECEVSATERINEIWALERRVWLLGRVVCGEEGAPREEADRLGDCRLEKTAILRICGPMGG